MAEEEYKFLQKSQLRYFLLYNTFILYIVAADIKLYTSHTFTQCSYVTFFFGSKSIKSTGHSLNTIPSNFTHNYLNIVCKL